MSYDPGATLASATAIEKMPLTHAAPVNVRLVETASLRTVAEGAGLMHALVTPDSERTNSMVALVPSVG